MIFFLMVNIKLILITKSLNTSRSNYDLIFNSLKIFKSYLRGTVL